MHNSSRKGILVRYLPVAEANGLAVTDVAGIVMTMLVSNPCDWGPSFSTPEMGWVPTCSTARVSRPKSVP